jgi:thiosulfate/3-mercaptopyruvate sulfurtransferase
MTPLITVEELHSRLEDPDLRVCDVRWYLGEPDRGSREYQAGHLPGAIFVDLDRDLADPPGRGRHPLPDPDRFTARMGEIGIGDGHTVVAYDSSGGMVAARLWWMLTDLGHPRVALVDGGFPAWVAAGLPVSADPVVFPAAVLSLKHRWSGEIEREQLVARLGSLKLIDARAPERYRGEVEPVDPKAGHIPGARSIPTAGHLTEAGLLRPQLESFTGIGGEVVAYCGSGVNACHTILAMVVAGLPPPLLYAGSWSDWSSTDLPVATGPAP